MKSNLRYSLIEEDGIVRILLTGDLDSTNALHLLDYLRNSLTGSIKKLVFLVDGLDYISAEGFKTLICATNEVKVESRVILVNKNSFIYNLIKETGLESLFKIQLIN
ncbi:MAG: STAS domain-containing protein [Bacillota bacterium]